MKTFKNVLKNYLYPAGFLFSVFTLIVYIVSNTSTKTTLINILMFVYFILVSAATKIFKTSISMFFKIIVHFSIITVPLIAIFSYLRGFETPGRNIFGIIFLAAFIYALIAVPVLLIKRSLDKKDDETKVYKNQFDKIR